MRGPLIYKALTNELVNDGIKLSKLKINTGFINRLPKKWLAFCPSLKSTNHVKESKLASLFGKLKYKENPIDSIYGTNKEKTLVSATLLSTAFFSTSIVQDFQDSPNDEGDARSSQEYMNDLEEEYQARALLAKSKRFFKKATQRFSGAKATDQTECHKCGKKGKNKGLIAETYEWDEEEVLSDENEGIEVNARMALTKEERVYVGKESASNGEWVKISIQKTSSSRPKDLVFIKSLADNSNVSITSSNKTRLSEAEDSTLPNHDTADESSVCSTPLPPLE
ncbi:hypothetical protein Tco_1248267, partial [Tanacetum coccineum]